MRVPTLAAAAALTLLASTPTVSWAQARTLTVWAMQDMHTDQTLGVLKTEFAKLHPDVTVNIQIQQWDGITTKLTTGLSQSSPPDIVEIGNTYAPLFAASGALADLTGHADELRRGQHWLDGLSGPATYDNALYAVPLFNGSGGVVIYNKDIWAEAGVEGQPRSFAELTAALDKVRAKHPEDTFSPFYYPARNWKGNVPFVWDAGGSLARLEDGQWKVTLNSPQSVAGLEAWRDFQNRYSAPGSRNADPSSPDQAAVLAAGQASAILGSESDMRRILSTNPALKGKLGTFALPSTRAGADKPLFLGGCVLAIAARSPNADIALDWLRVASSDSFQVNQVVGSDGFGPISSELIAQVVGGRHVPALSVPFFEAAAHSVATPASPGWSTIENDRSLDGLFADIATGSKTPQAAADAFAPHFEAALNAGP